MKIGVMGAHGSFSEQAGEQYRVEQSLKEATIEPLITGEAVLDALEKETIDLGIMPIENSNGGIVIEAVYAMARHRFEVQSMFEYDVHHMLLVRPGVNATTIDTIVSHDQALKQCRMYVRRRWPGAEVRPYADTAQAAADLGQGKLSEATAVIAPRRCAELYGLEVLEESIQDLKFNYTTFLVAVKSSL